MAAVISQGQTTTATSGATSIDVSLPAREAGDFVLVAFFGPRTVGIPTTSPAVPWVKSFDLAGQGEIFLKEITGTGPAGTLVTFQLSGTAGDTTAVAFLVKGGTTNPNLPGGNEAIRQALMGMVTGAVSGLPFNSGVNPVGRTPSFAGREGIQDTIESSANRGVPFDIRCDFQYQNRNISEGSTAWNDLIGIQVLDWFDPARPCVMGFKPFPTGGSYTAAKNGNYDSQLVAIGQTIASKRPAGTGKVILRLAWEMNGYWYDHCAFRTTSFTPVADYVAGTQRIITKIREGAGDRVEFIQCWSASQNDRYLSTYWGDDYADAISIDVYDAFAGTNNGIHTRAQLLATGLGEMYDFARAHGKLVAIDEWGGHNTAGEGSNGNDNPDFPVVMYDWLNEVRDTILYEAQFNDSAIGNVQNNLYATGGSSIDLPLQRASLISKVRSFV